MTRKQSTKPQRIVLSVKHRRLNGVGFGGYIEGTSRRRGHAQILVDLDAIAYVAAMHGTKEFKRTFIETVAHEFMHALKDRFGLMFNEKRVEAAIRRGAEAMGYGDQERVQAPKATAVQAGRVDSASRRRRADGRTPSKAAGRNA